MILKEHKICQRIIVIYSLFSLLLGACSKPLEQHEIASPPKKLEWKLPIKIPAGEFYEIAGWISDNKIIYITNLDLTSNVYQYDLTLGTSKLIYQSTAPIAAVQISPSKKYLLIQTAPSTYQGIITMTNLSGKELMKESITAHEIQYEWNPYHDNQILITKFNEDWTYQMLLIDITNSSTTSIDLPQPFIKWTADKTIGYLNWNQDQSELSAPLIERNLNTSNEKTILSSVYQFSTFRNLLMTITVNKEDPNSAIYSFYKSTRKELFHFSIPQLSRFSDWLVPFYDFNEKKEEFITLSPLESGEADAYTKGFDLVQYDLKKGSKHILLKELKNEPLQFSPSGNACLYGNSFEKIIDFNQKKIINTVQE